ncbi:MAG: hypothetical protein WCP08_17040, partial [Prolixibacteraceae bacterium]
MAEDNLRRRAEDLLKKKDSKSITQLTEAEISRLIYELQTHEIELELQNEELVLAKELASVTSEKYIQLYDFAPSGYFT